MFYLQNVFKKKALNSKHTVSKYTIKYLRLHMQTGR